MDIEMLQACACIVLTALAFSGFVIAVQYVWERLKP